MPKFVPRERKRRRLDKQRTGNAVRDTSDSNTVEIVSKSKEEKEKQRQRLKDKLTAHQPKYSSKKKKRLDKYIDNKLRKEENLELLKKLAQTKIDTSLLHSSQKLGTTGKSKREILLRAHHEREAGINITENDWLLSHSSNRSGKAEETYASDTASGTSAEDVYEQDAGSVKPNSLSEQATSVFGSGLKRPLEVGGDGRPVIKKRQRVMPARSQTISVDEPEDRTSDDEWNGVSDNEKPASSSARDENDKRKSGDKSLSDRTVDEEDGDGSGSSGYSSQSESENGEDGVSAFKAWASKQRNDALGFVPAADTKPQIFHVPNGTRSAHAYDVETEPLPPELQPPKAAVTRQVHTVSVVRSAEIEEARSKLPVVAEEQKIMEAIHNNDIVIIWGATGSGKTTQIPQFLLEAGYGDKAGPNPGLIGVTQPRRVAAVSMAQRVGEELGNTKSRVGYKIRFDGSIGSETAIKFMTDGVLLREISIDIQLSKYSAIIIDEAHERSVNTDILIGMLSRTVMKLRSSKAPKVDGAPSLAPLKVIIMSATLRIKDFLENPHLFPGPAPPLVQAEGRQYPVTVHFARKTRSDYVEEAFKKVSRGHKKLPKGSMLVFLTGQNEIIDLQKKLRNAFQGAAQATTLTYDTHVSATDAPLEVEDLEIRGKGFESDGSDDEIDILGLDDHGAEVDDDDTEFDIGQTEEERHEQTSLKVHVLPLYSQLPTKEQLRVFEAPPDGSRLIVLATNVAETSLTIPGIRYVFDCGRAKEKTYNLETGVQSFDIGWISKASAEQRAGRAGRTGPGHCYRLYSSALYEAHFQQHTEPEILKTPMESVVLQIRGIGLKDVVSFPFPTAPARHSIQRAERLLQNLGAISSEGRLTNIGRKLSTFPLSPRYSRMLLLALDRGIASLGTAMVAALSVPELFLPRSLIPHQASISNTERDCSDDDIAVEDEARQKAYNRAHHEFSQLDALSDAIKLLSATYAYSKAVASAVDTESVDQWCAAHFLRSKGLKEVTQLREQLNSISRSNYPQLAGYSSSEVPKPKQADIKLLRAIVAAGFVDQVAIRADLLQTPPDMPRKASRAIDVPYKTLFPSNDRTVGLDFSDPSASLVFIHPTSLLARRSASKMPPYVIYSHLQRSTTGKVRMQPLTPVMAAEVAMLARDTPLLEVSKPLDRVQALSVDERICNVTVSLAGEVGSAPWPLTTWKVRQKRNKMRGWEIVERLD